MEIKKKRKGNEKNTQRIIWSGVEAYFGVNV